MDWQRSGCAAARVAREDRAGYVIYTERRAARAALRGRLRFDATHPDELPAVGDWVALQWTDPDVHALGAERIRAVIVSVLPRLTAVRRTAAGRAGQTQVLAANVDRLLICAGLDADFNLRRIERYLSVAYAGGVSPVIVLTKADLAADLARQVREVESVAPDATVIATSAVSRLGLDQVRAQLRTGLTAALVGSSGVGKSTLVNELLGEDRMRTAGVRESDGRGRHTTTHRQLMLLPGGGVLIDTPGMRELQLPAGGDGLGSTFADIDALAAGCRFRDCAHESEPGCAVRAAVGDGRLEEARLRSYEKQQRELRHLARRDDPLAAADELARWKALHRAARRLYRSKRRM